MNKKSADNFFDDVDFVSIISNVKGIMTSDGTMSVLLDFERVLDDANLYAFKNWELGELVSGPDMRRYSVACVFMWTHKLMPDPNGAKRLVNLGCDVAFKKSKIDLPIEVKSYEDFVQGTRYPKAVEKEIWLVRIEIPKQLMNDIRQGSIDLAGQTIELNELEDAYQEDLDKTEGEQQEEGAEGAAGGAEAGAAAAAPMAPMPGM